jgi:phenylpyruvate tautomerase PptA (4-oxalocrotonate tautomerase family)
MDRPEQFIMTKTEFELSMQLGNSDAVSCSLAFHPHSPAVGRVSNPRHATQSFAAVRLRAGPRDLPDRRRTQPQTTKVLTDAIVSVLSGEGSRVFVIVEDVPNTNWSADGKLLTWIDN